MTSYSLEAIRPAEFIESPRVLILYDSEFAFASSCYAAGKGNVAPSSKLQVRSTPFLGICAQISSISKVFLSGHVVSSRPNTLLHSLPKLLANSASSVEYLSTDSILFFADRLSTWPAMAGLVSTKFCFEHSQYILHVLFFGITTYHVSKHFK